MTAPTFLQLNLSDKTFEVKSYEELVPRVGGLGWALPLFEKFLSEDPIVFAVGPLSAVFPGASKTVAVFRSPQTHGLVTSFAGGQLAHFLRAAGYQGMVVVGRSVRPTFVSVDEERINFSDASPFLGLDTPKAFERILSSVTGVPGRQSILVSGPAAEQGLVFSPLYLDEFFSFPRGGLGRAFAQRNLKGISISGKKGEPIPNARRYEEVFAALIKNLKGYSELSELGTLRNLTTEKKLSAVATNNLTEFNFVAEELLAPKFARELGARRVACGGCPVGCIHLLRQEKRFTFYDYDGVVALGPFLGLSSAGEVGRLLERVWELGLDPTSLGVILAYTTEKEKLEFGNLETYLTLTEALFAGKEDWAKDLYGGLSSSPTALTFGGMEFLPYFNGYASVLSQVLQLGATTEENRGFWLDLDLMGKEIDPADLVSRLINAEEKKTLAQLLIGCGYLVDTFEDLATAFAALEAFGQGFSHERLLNAAKETLHLKIKIQRSLGFRPKNVRIPERFFQTPSPQGLLKKEKLAEMIRIYSKKIYEPTN